ncbi:MAG: double-strand break repair protein AddB, partial [Pseudomonadota bacterium]
GEHAETRAVALARAMDRAPRAPAYARPQPDPSAAQRDVALSVTAIDRLRGDPYQFYAQAILRLRSLDPLDSAPTAAWKGTVVHGVLDRWHQAGEGAGLLLALAGEELAAMRAHPLVRSLWWPRLARALEWIDLKVTQARGEGRSVIGSELDGEMTFAGVKVQGRADRIDRLPDGKLAIVDYKTGEPPTGKMVADGFALQLGVLALIAEAGGFAGVAGDAERFEYWTLGKSKKSDTGFGDVEEPILEGRKRSGVPRDEFLGEMAYYLGDAIERWIKGREPFTARLNPDLGGYNDYDQLMRLDEWQARSPAGGEGA